LTDPHILAPLIRRWERRCALSGDDLEALAALPIQRKTVEKDAYLVREGDAARDCALLLTGFAYRQKLVRDGARQIVSIHMPGEFVDLQNMLLTQADHNVQALGRAEVALVPKAALMELAQARPAVGRAMWLDTLIDGAIFREWVVNVGRRNARSRIAHLLCELALRLETLGLAADGNYDVPLTQEQLADATGLTAVHTNRVLQTLRRDGLISLSGHALRVLDWGGLETAGDFNRRYLHSEVERFAASS
jgi:CRP-like cAMP-binding protein